MAHLDSQLPAPWMAAGHIQAPTQPTTRPAAPLPRCPAAAAAQSTMSDPESQWPSPGWEAESEAQAPPSTHTCPRPQPSPLPG